MPKTKTGRRTHDLAAAALEILSTLPRINDWCFTVGRDAPITYRYAYVVFAEAARAAGLDDVRLHDLRRTVMTSAAAAGVGTHVLRDLLGHKTTAMADRYIRNIGNPVREAREQVGAAMAAMMKGEGGKVVPLRRPGTNRQLDSRNNRRTLCDPRIKRIVAAVPSHEDGPRILKRRHSSGDSALGHSVRETDRCSTKTESTWPPIRRSRRSDPTRPSRIGVRKGVARYLSKSAPKSPMRVATSICGWKRGPSGQKRLNTQRKNPASSAGFGASRRWRGPRRRHRAKGAPDASPTYPNCAAGTTSNVAPILVELAERAALHYGRSTASWLEAAAVILEARKIAEHGDWTLFLRDAGIPARTASRMLDFARAGIQIGQMADLSRREIAALIAEAHRIFPGPADAEYGGRWLKRS